MSRLHKLLLSILLVGLGGGMWYFMQSQASTTIDLTLTNNESLFEGLVAHYTFDGPEVDWTGPLGGFQSRGEARVGDASASMGLENAAPGRIGQGMFFDGVGDFIDAGSDTDIDSLNSGPLTVTAYIRVAEYPATNPGRIVTTGYPKNWAFSLTMSGKLRFEANRNGPSDLAVESTETLTAGEWYHVALRWDGTLSTGSVHMYINTVETGYALQQAGSGARGTDNTQALRVGASEVENDFLAATLDEVYVYNRVLDLSEVDRIFALGNTTRIGNTLTSNSDLEEGLVGHWTMDGEDTVWVNGVAATSTDRTGNGNHGTIYGAMPEMGVLGQGMRFDGVGDAIYSDANNFPNTGSTETVALWAYMPDGSCGIDTGTIAYLKDSDTNADISLRCNWSTLYVAGYGDGKIVQLSVSGADWLYNSWNHIAYTFNGTTNRIYVNGWEAASSTTALGTGSVDTFSIGDDDYVDWEFKGVLDDVRIYNRALSADEVKRLYELGATTRVAETLTTNPTLESGLVSHWTFDGSDVDWNTNTAQDRSGNGYHTSLEGGAVPAMGTIGQGIRLDGTDDYLQVVGVSVPILDTTNLTVMTGDPLAGPGGTHTVPSGTDLLVVMLQGWEIGDSNPPTSVTWNGANLTRIDLTASCGATGWGNTQHGLWYLANPTPASGATLAITGGSPNLTDGGIAHILNLSNVDTTVGTSGIVDCANIQSDTYTTITLAPTTVANYLLLTQWSQQGGTGTTGQTYGGTSGTQNIEDVTGFNGDAAFLTTSFPSASGQNITFLGASGTIYPSGLSLSIAGDAGTSLGTVRTISFWVKPESATEILVDLNGYANIDILSGTVRANNYSGATIYVDGVQTTSFPDTGWHHVTVTNTTATTTDAFSVGKIGSSYLEGVIDDVRVYNKALSAVEVRRLYEMGQ